MKRPKHLLIIFLIVHFFVTGCKKTEESVMKDLTFPSEITFSQLEDETVLFITNSGTRSLMLNFTFSEVVNWQNSLEIMRVLPSGETLEIVAVSNHPRNVLLAIYPATGQTKEVLLNSKPLSMHLSTAMGKVVVGQTDRFTIVDLALFETVRETQTEMDLSAVFMPNEDWLFATPEYSYLHRINLKTGEITVNNYYGFIKLKQHPFRENALLGSIMNLHPSMMDVYDISNENFEKLYSSERSDDLRDVHDNFWLIRSNQLIFSRGKCVFTCSPVQEQDVKFVEMLSEGNVINSMVNTDRFAQIATITRYQNVWLPDKNDVLFYNHSDFSVTGKIPVPIVNTQPGGPSEGFFIFTDKAQKNLYVLAADHFELFAAVNWTLLGYDLEKLFTVP